MSTRHNSTWRWLAILVLAHLVVSIVHGMAHVDANVPLTLAQISFVVIVILAGRLVGLAMTSPSPRIGGWLIALTMAASLVFGVLNHFVVESPDHVAQVTGESSALFAAAAVLIVVTEALGTAPRYCSSSNRRPRASIVSSARRTEERGRRRPLSSAGCRVAGLWGPATRPSSCGSSNRQSQSAR